MEVLHNKVMEVYGSITQERSKLLAENMLQDPGDNMQSVSPWQSTLPQ